MPEYAFPYGASTLTLKLPDGLKEQMVHPPVLDRLVDPIHVLREGLENPTGRPPLKLIAKGQESCIIVATPRSLPAAYALWLPEFLNQLNAAGNADKSISIYIANGLETPMSAEERQAHFGAEVCSRVQFTDHNPDAPALMRVGRTDWGTILTVDEQVFRCDMLVLTGAIRYHPIAGFTGGRYGILPGCCGREAIRTNAKRGFAGGGLAKGVGPAIMVNSPVSEDMHEACTLVKPNLAIDVVLSADGGIAWLGVGDYGYIHKIGAKYLEEASHAKLPLKASVAVVGAGNSGSTLESAVRSLNFSAGAIVEGAQVIWVADCAAGEGSSEFGDWRGLSAEEAEQRLPGSSLTEAAQAACFLKQYAQRYHIQIISDLDEGSCSAWGLAKAESLDKALARAVNAAGSGGHTWLVAPDMSNALADSKG